mmetsp:Transcript_32128/g.75447  ORF Transcript_32128/g.75447 Transcript_32128/m.75447 type:complete len:207 (-) Transcript_32128:280-900(-)
MGTRSQLILTFFVGLCLEIASGNSVFIAKLCRDHWCEDPRFPLLDYEDGECVCKPHPCWELNGEKNACTDPVHRFMHYYWEDGTWECLCSSIPHYDSPHLVKNLCPGGGCDAQDRPILEYDEETGECGCTVHPCSNIDGQEYSCPNEKFPILRYREDADGTPQCDCVARMEEPSPLFRGLRGFQDELGKCTMASEHHAVTPSPIVE